ncbi:uncharacterized protein LOC144013320 isoform X1 [Festucalex cinctus]
MWPRRACEDDQVSTVLIVLFTYTGLRCDGGPKCGEAGRGGREGSPKSFVNKNEEAKTRKQNWEKSIRTICKHGDLNVEPESGTDMPTTTLEPEQSINKLKLNSQEKRHFPSSSCIGFLPFSENAESSMAWSQ